MLHHKPSSTLPSGHVPGPLARAPGRQVVAAAKAAIAANADSLAKKPRPVPNPLWVITVGMGLFFLVTAAVMAFD